MFATKRLDVWLMKPLDLTFVDVSMAIVAMEKLALLWIHQAVWT